MSKKKAKRGLPKRLAGVKVPKTIRRGAIGDFLSSPAGRKMLAEGLLMLSAVAMGRESGKDSSARKALKTLGEGKLGQAAAELGSGAADAMGDGQARLTYALREAQRAFREALASPPPAASDEPAAAVLETAPETAKKKRSSVTAEYGSTH